MAQSNTLARTLHDAGLAAWFGGNLFGAGALNPATKELDTPADTLRAANSSWGRWTPINAAAIAAHLIGGAIVTVGNKSRFAGQQGVGAQTAAKTALTAAALGATAYSRKLGQQVMDYESQVRANASQPGAQDATTPEASTPSDVADAQRKLKLLQWAVPVLTGGIMVINTYMGEKQRPSQVAKGFLARLLP